MLTYISKVWFILKGSRKNIPFLLLTFSLSSLLEALGIGLIGPFLNLASNPELIHKIPILQWTYIQLKIEHTTQLISILGLTIAGLFCIKSLFYFLAQYYIFYFTFSQKVKLISRLLSNYLAAPYTFYLYANTATIIKNFTYETMTITQSCLLPLLNAIANSIVIFALLILLVKTNIVFLNIVLAITLPTFLLFYKFRNKLEIWGRESSDSNQEMLRIINHSLGGLKEARVIGCEAFFEKQMEKQVKLYKNAATKAYSFNILPRITIETLLIVFILIFISVSQLFYGENIQELTSVMAVFAVASIRLIPAVSQTLQAMGQLQNSSHSINVIYSDLREIEKQVKTKHTVSMSNLRDKLYNLKVAKNYNNLFDDEVEVSSIIYYYPGTSKATIDNVSLKIKKGQSIGIIGKSGAGKTTLVDILLGLLYIDSGDIKVDNVSIYENIRSWQNLLGYIPQSIFLMDDSIKRNIAFGVPDHYIDLERLKSAIKAAQLEELVEQLPHGINTNIGERGVRLSGGQRQRIGIARALYHQREILVLDEATSALDKETEQLVSEAIRSLAGIKTLIIIAHRLSTVEHCDCIYMLEKGRVVKSGNYQEVVLDNGRPR